MKKQISFSYVAFGVIAFGALFLNSDNGRAGNYSGLSSDSGTCGAVGCHAGGTVNGTGVALSGAPASYVAGQVYPMTLTLKDPDAVSGGFQIVATNGTTTTQIGAFTAGTGSKINNTLRLVQSTPKLFASGGVSWSFNWTAPSTGTAAKFHYSAVASNNDGFENIGDAVYTGSQTGPLTAVKEALLSVEKLNIYPNILRKGGNITVKMVDNVKEASIEIVDLSGKVLKTVQKAAYTEGSLISTSDLPTGRFFVRSNDKTTVQTGDITIL
jgi:Secretion system C-terminal sorting domain